jgi:hypothetical protein
MPSLFLKNVWAQILCYRLADMLCLFVRHRDWDDVYQKRHIRWFRVMSRLE